MKVCIVSLHNWFLYSIKAISFPQQYWYQGRKAAFFRKCACLFTFWTCIHPEIKQIGPIVPNQTYMACLLVEFCAFVSFLKKNVCPSYFPYLLSFLCIGGETGPCMCLVIFFSFVNFYPIEKLIHTPCSNLNNFYFYSLHLNLFKCVITPHHNF